MKQKISPVLALFGMALMLCACGTVVKETVSPHSCLTIGQEHGRILLLPFADYSQGSTPDDYARRQVKLHEAFTYQLGRYRITAPVREDVIQALLDMRVIEKSASQDLLRDEEQVMGLGSGWSEEMYNEIRLVTQAEAGTRGIQKAGTVGFDRERIMALGKRFDADFVLRGRIVEYEVRDEHTLEPARRGLLPFFFDTTSSLIFGVAESETYDIANDMTIGGGLGALLSETDSATIGGGVGAGFGYLANRSGKVPQGVVQVSVALQDATTGDVVWSNRIEVQVAPETAWADRYPRTVIDRAVELAAERLVEAMLARS